MCKSIFHKPVPSFVGTIVEDKLSSVMTEIDPDVIEEILPYASVVIDEGYAYVPIVPSVFNETVYVFVAKDTEIGAVPVTLAGDVPAVMEEILP